MIVLYKDSEDLYGYAGCPAAQKFFFSVLLKLLKKWKIQREFLKKALIFHSNFYFFFMFLAILKMFSY